MASSLKMPPVTGYGLSMLGLQLISIIPCKFLDQYNTLGVDV